ncbi:MAG: sirohydrochlorin chelatase [Roseiflexaceae bacterium]|nr:sirohydrochlorin chelatase [Roseiflexaceae bacterium]
MNQALRTPSPVSNQHSPQYTAVLLVGHGSLRRASGAAMIRLAARLRASGVAPITQAAFLNYSRPSVAEGVARCVARGAREIVVVPYFLVAGWFVKQALPQQLQSCRAQYPAVSIRQTEALGDHPALAHLVMQRALEADYLHAFPQLRDPAVNRLCIATDTWQPLHTAQRTGLLLVAHGSPEPESNRPIYAVAERIRASSRYAAVTVCFMDLNRPSIGEAVGDFAQIGLQHTLAVPYFLQLGNHVAKDLPQLFSQANEHHPQMNIVVAEHLGYDRLLLAPIADRVCGAAAVAGPLDRPTLQPAV